MKRSSRNVAGFFIVLIPLLVLWFTRLWALDLLPLHNDEGLHLTRAVEVWNGHPFWAISDGKIINHWLIAVFSPQVNPVFAGRITTIFVAMLGLSAGYALARRLAGRAGAALASALWIGSPYLFFYERLAFSDAEAGALVVVAVWLAVRAVEARRMRLAILSGVFFGAAALFKFTAAPYALALALIFLFYPADNLFRRIRLRYGIAALLAAGAGFVVPLGYLALRGDDFFSIALGWIGGSSGGQPAFFANVTRLVQQFTGFGTVGWAVLTLLGLLALAVRARGKAYAFTLFLSALIPLFIILLLGKEVLSRHFVVALPLLLTGAGAGLGIALQRVRESSARQMVAGFGVAALVLGAAPVFLTAYSDPASMTLPEDVRYEHITSHSAGYALREAVQDLPLTLVRRDLPVIASMFPDSCRRANFYAVNELKLTCVDAPGREQIDSALDEDGAVYVLVESAPLIGLDVTTLDARVTRLAVYPRPGEREANAAVILWVVEKPDASAALPADCSPETLGAVTTSIPAYVPSVVNEFVRLDEGRFMVGDAVFVPRGVNYYPVRYPWRRFLTEADLTVVNNELALLRATGFNTLRIFLWNEALFACPGAGAIPLADAFGRLDAVIQSAASQGFRLILTLNDLPDLTTAALYDNPPHVLDQTRFIVERYGNEAAGLAWDLRNEGDIDYGSNNSATVRFPREQVLFWLEQTATFVRGIDNRHLITAGWLHDSESTAPYVDFISFHHWEDAARLRERLAGIRAATDKPILLEEFGFSTFRVSPEEQRQLIEDVIAISDAENLLGWLIWTAFDFPLDATCVRPACPSADNAEHHFGLWYADYAPKPIVEFLLSTLSGGQASLFGLD